VSGSIDASFTELPYSAMADAALDNAKQLKTDYADFRFERIKSQSIRMKDVNLESLVTSEEVGFAVRVISGGAWGFAAGVTLTPEAAADAARRAADVASTLSALNSEPVDQANEPVHVDSFISAYEADPFQVSDEDKISFLKAVNERVLVSNKVAHVDFSLSQVLENKFLASSEGSRTTQQRVRLQGNFEAVRVDKDSGAFETMRSNAHPVGKGWEYISSEHDFMKDAEEIPELLEEKMASKSVEPGKYDLVIHPSNLFLTIHESIGHATELDRALGYEAAYAGTSFATVDKLGSLKYGSEVMHVTGDRVAEHGLATIGYDDEGVAAQEWDLIKDGILVGYQLNRQMAKKQGYDRSNGCAFADSPFHVPIQRMPNVSLQPSSDDTTLDDLIGGVEKGIYIVGDKSWSIDMQRYNFQFTGQAFYEIRSGKILGQLKDVAYQATTTDFWNAMEAVGGASTYVLSGAFNCGKGQPGQIAPVSHGAPAALFRQINILNTARESS
jgi:TldD protein